MSRLILIGMAVFFWAGAMVKIAKASDASSAFPLVDGVRQAVIVSGQQGPKERLGWRYEGEIEANPVFGKGGGEILQKWIEQSTGRKLALIQEKEYDPSACPIPIFVGGTAKAKELFGEKLKTLDTDGYIIHVASDFVVLAGNVRYAETDFLRTYLGIDSYLPIRLFTVVPKHDHVLIPTETRIEIPVFFSRSFSNLRTDNSEKSDNGEYGMPEIPWRLHPGIGNGRYKFHHNIHNFITVKEFGQVHPEYFPLIGGKRLIASGGAQPGPCLSNSEVVKIIIKKCREHFDRHPEALAISLGMPDVGSGSWCECTGCKAMDGTSVKVNGRSSPRSNRYYAFLNQVAKALQQSHPGKSVGTLGYLGTENPPSFQVERNIIVYICDNRADWCNPAEKKKDLEIIDAWLDRVDHVGIYEYLYGMGFSIPRLYTRALAEFLQRVAGKKPGSGFYAEIYSNHGLDGPKAYIVEKLLWNPNQNLDNLMNQWSEACFGPAAAPMKQYFDLLEETWMRNGARVKPSGILWGFRREEQYEMFRPEDLPTLWKLLDEAKAKAGSDETILKRIAYFADTFKISDIMTRRYHAFAEPVQLIKDKAPPEKVLASLLHHAPEAPAFGLEALIRKVWAELPCAYSGNGQPKRAVKALHYIFDTGPWQTVAELIKAGERNPAEMASQAGSSLLKILPGGYEKDPAARAFADNLLRGAERVVQARRTNEPPVIDGNPSESSWHWTDRQSWFYRDSADLIDSGTCFAWAYDQENLYLAIRCPGQTAALTDGLDYSKATGYGCSAWNFPSVEVELYALNRKLAMQDGYSFAVTCKGGVWENRQGAMTACVVQPGGPEEWQAEIAWSWQKLGLDPATFSGLRINLLRNLRSRWSLTTSTWFPTYKPDKGTTGPGPTATGWLMLEN